MAPFPLTGATSLINKNDNNRNKMIFQHILQDVFQHHQPQLPAPPSPLLEIKRRFEWTLITQQKHVPTETTNFQTKNIISEATLIKLSPSSSSSSAPGSSTTSHDYHSLLKSPSLSSNQPSSPLTMIFSPTQSHDVLFGLNDTFLLLGVDNDHFFGVNVLCFSFCAGRLTITMSRTNLRTCWMEMKSYFVVIKNGICYDNDLGFILENINVKAGWIGIHQSKHHLPLVLLPPSSTSVKLTQGMKKNCPDLVSWQKKDDGDTIITDYNNSIFIDQHPFLPDQTYPNIIDFTSPSCHVETDNFTLSPSISSTSTSSSTTSCNFWSPPGSPLFNPTITSPLLYDYDDELDDTEDQYESFASASLVALIQETLQYIHSSPSQHSYSTELESLVPKMGNFLSHSL